MRLTSIGSQISNNCPYFSSVADDHSRTPSKIQLEAETPSSSFISVQQSRLNDGPVEIEDLVERSFVATFETSKVLFR